MPVRSSKAILDFKWIDHCSAIGLDYLPRDISASWLPSQVAKKQKLWHNKAIYAARAKLSNLYVREEQVARDLLYASQSQPYLSSDAVISMIDEKLDKLVDQIKVDIETDPFFALK